MTARVTQLVVGPDRHGVVRFGLELHEQLRRTGCDAELCRRIPIPKPCDLVHIQFTDRLFGAGPDAATDSFTTVADQARRHGARVCATLHDLPQPSDGANFRRRTAAYRRVAAACDGVVVSSNHERELLRDCEISGAQVAVIPLPVARRVDGPDSGAPEGRSLGVFGFLYPGKGHAEVIEAASDLPRDVAVLAIGEASDGHDDLIADLQQRAARQKRTFRITGHIADAELTAALRQVTVPIAAHRHVSASGSLNTWLTAGRRPLAPVNRYTSEVERRNPGTVALYDDTALGLKAAVAAALERPESTWLAADVTLTPTPAEAAADYADFFEQWLA